MRYTTGMTRAVLAILTLSLAVALLPSVSHAQSSGWQSIAGSGYTFQIPPGWSSIQNPHPGGRIETSPDFSDFVFAEVISNSPSTVLTTAQEASAGLAGVMAGVATASPGETGFTVTSGPTPTQVSGADMAATSSTSYFDENGILTDEYTIGAARAITTYFLTVGLPADQDLSNPSLAQGILGSFRLTSQTSVAASPPVSAVPGTSPPSTTGAPSSTTTSAAVPGFQDSGTTSKQTKSFTVPANWSVQYTYDCTRFANSLSGGFLNIFVMYPTGAYLLGDSSPIELQGVADAGGDVVSFSTPGTFYLSVVTPCSWAVTIPEAASSVASHP